MFLPYQPAPPDEMVRYLAILRRVLVSIENHGKYHSIRHIVFAGYLADAFHSVPTVLWHWNEEGGLSPSELHVAITQGLPHGIEREGGTPGMIDEVKALVTPANDAALLGLRDDLSDYALAPQADRERYLDLLQNYFIAARLLRNYGRSRFQTEPPLKNPTVLDTAKPRADGREKSLIACFLREIPSAIVAWPRFDESAFRGSVEECLSVLPEGEYGWLRRGLSI